MVEIDKKKRSYLAKQFPHVRLFKDMGEMGKEQAEAHNGNYYPVPKAWLMLRQCLMNI